LRDGHAQRADRGVRPRQPSPERARAKAPADLRNCTGKTQGAPLSDEVAPLPEQVDPHSSTVPFRKIFVNAAKDVLRLVAWLAHGDTGDEVDHFAEHHLHHPSSAGRLWSLGRTPFRPGVATSIAAIASSISLPMLRCLALA